MADIVRQQSRCDLRLEDLIGLYGIKKSTFYDWQNAPALKPEKPPVVSTASVRPEEIQAVLAYRDLHPSIGYRKFTWQMVDANIAYIKVGGILYFLIMMLDGYSRYLLEWELMTDMLGGSVETFVQRVKEKYPYARPKLIHDNGSQFISHDFKRLLQKLEIQQIFTRRNHPQTNGKIERLNGTVKQEALRPGQPCDFQEAWEILNKYSYEYNHQRLHAGISFLRPADMFFGRSGLILNERREKIENARADRKSLNREERMKNLH